MNWTPDEMDRLERAIVEESRIQIARRGTEYVVIPREITSGEGTEILHALNTTGDELSFRLSELESFEVVR